MVTWADPGRAQHQLAARNCFRPGLAGQCTNSARARLRHDRDQLFARRQPGEIGPPTGQPRQVHLLASARGERGREPPGRRIPVQRGLEIGPGKFVGTLMSGRKAPHNISNDQVHEPANRSADHLRGRHGPKIPGAHDKHHDLLGKGRFWFVIIRPGDASDPENATVCFTIDRIRQELLDEAAARWCLVAKSPRVSQGRNLEDLHSTGISRTARLRLDDRFGFARGPGRHSHQPLGGGARQALGRFHSVGRRHRPSLHPHFFGG